MVESALGWSLAPVMALEPNARAEAGDGMLAHVVPMLLRGGRGLLTELEPHGCCLPYDVGGRVDLRLSWRYHPGCSRCAQQVILILECPREHARRWARVRRVRRSRARSRGLRRGLIGLGRA